MTVMNILGLQKTTLLDFPGKVASTIFLGGCNMCCPFCHNMNLVKDYNNPEFSQEDILDFLQARRGILDGVCITGGEPTIYSELPEFIHKIKALGLLVKLDTNGTNPDMLRYLSDKGLIDYIAMDIKTSIDNYGTVCGNPNIDTDAIKQSVSFILSGTTDYEFRTTIIQNYHDICTIQNIGILINGARRYFLQSFTDSEYVPDHSLEPCSVGTLKKYVEILSEYVDSVSIRGVDI